MTCFLLFLEIEIVATYIKDEALASVLGEIDSITEKLKNVVSSSNISLAEGAAAVAAALDRLPAASDKEAARSANAAILGVSDRMAEVVANAAQALAQIEAQAQEHRDKTKSYKWAGGLILITALAAGASMYFLKAGLDAAVLAAADSHIASADQMAANKYKSIAESALADKKTAEVALEKDKSYAVWGKSKSGQDNFANYIKLMDCSKWDWQKIKVVNEKKGCYAVGEGMLSSDFLMFQMED